MKPDSLCYHGCSPWRKRSFILVCCLLCPNLFCLTIELTTTFQLTSPSWETASAVDPIQLLFFVFCFFASSLHSELMGTCLTPSLSPSQQRTSSTGGQEKGASSAVESTTEGWITMCIFFRHVTKKGAATQQCWLQAVNKWLACIL